MSLADKTLDSSLQVHHVGLFSLRFGHRGHVENFFLWNSALLYEDVPSDELGGATRNPVSTNGRWVHLRLGKRTCGGVLQHWPLVDRRFQINIQKHSLSCSQHADMQASFTEKGSIWAEIAATTGMSHTYTCTHVHMYTCTHVHMYTCTHVHMYTCTHVRMYTCTHVRMYACTHVRMYACTHVRMYACTHVRMYACTHVRMYACTHVRMYSYT